MQEIFFITPNTTIFYKELDVWALKYNSILKFKKLNHKGHVFIKFESLSWSIEAQKVEFLITSKAVKKYPNIKAVQYVYLPHKP